MQIYNNKNWKLEEVRESWFELEKYMQKLTEENLDEVFWLEFISTEFQLNNLRLDSLAFDRESNSFVIIEYKRWSSYSVIDQWMSYLALMLNNKADFVQELSRKRREFIDIKEIDWSQSKIIIIADSFNRYQKESINFKDLAIELWELKKFQDWTIVFNSIKAENKTESIKTITKFETGEFKEINREIKNYTVEDKFKEWRDQSRELYEIFRDKIISLDSRIEENPVKYEISFKIKSKVVFYLWTYKEKISLHFWKLKSKDFSDPENKIDDLINRKNCDRCKFNIKNKEDIDYWIMLVKQVLKKFF